jgi:hypothetical protein
MTANNYLVLENQITKRNLKFKMIPIMKDNNIKILWQNLTLKKKILKLSKKVKKQCKK